MQSTQVVVKVGDCAVSRNPGEQLVTYALGSCVGVAAFDVKSGAGGLLHFQLPDSGISPEKARVQPAMFGNTGLVALLTGLFELGATRKSLKIYLAGGAAITGGDHFEIGPRNILIAKRILWKNSLIVSGEETGGTISRTMKLDISVGKVLIKDLGGEHFL